MGNTENYSLTHTPFHDILLWGNKLKSPRILFDNEANESFMDVTLASELDVTSQPLSISMDVRVLDGRSIGRVTHNTTTINLQVSGNHSETIQIPAH